MNLSRRVFTLAWASFLSVAVGASAAQPGPTEASLRAVDEQQRALVSESNLNELARLAHTNLLINGPSGRVITRDMFLEQVRSGEIAKEQFERIAQAVRITGNIGVLVGRENIVAAPGSRDFGIRGAQPAQRRYINVYMFERGRWLWLARQASVVTP